jgi:hypothetical protein
LLGERETALFELLLENVIEQRKKLIKRLEAGTKLTKELILNSWLEKRAGEEKKAILNALVFLRTESDKSGRG